MSNLSIFDIAGPIMVGPSSSHTAGACKIGQFARALFHRTPNKVTFYLHGSFGEVYKGHATDLALLAGVMKFRTSDPRIKDSFEIAKEKKIKYEFVVKDLGAKYHPNTVQVLLEDGKHKMSVFGSSVGGGMIEIVKINNCDVSLKGSAGKHLSLVVAHVRDPKIIPQIIEQIKKLGINVTDIEESAYKEKGKEEIISVLSLEGSRRITLPEVVDLEKNKGIDFIRSLSKLQTQ